MGDQRVVADMVVDCGGGSGGGGHQQLPTVVVTGFGVFRNYKLNPSWECVQRLRLKGCHLIVEEIPVVYDEVDKRVANIWTKHKPFLVIHCGVSSIAKCITLETKAVRQQRLYDKPDIYGRLPDDGGGRQPMMCADGNSCRQIGSTVEDECYDCIECGIDLQKVCNEVNQHFEKGLVRLGADLSSNAGRFLCEYIYCSSLKQCTDRTAFIHVPEISDNCPLEDIHSALELTIQTIVNHVMHSHK
ncbi:pyroglutamyl-peptidase 1-like [Oppia nitens]|uniref:pyroglutamyl-peptidase 1-like n=1 Tax=Oppia nitens TaxID=1686743 RepID=UPI0023DADB7B|nr:pyroglutamyl-peptidase 1-like [Oppia nitens]